MSTLAATDGVDLVASRENGEAVVRSGRGELRFSPGRGLADRGGRRWRVKGDRSALHLDVKGRRVTSETYPTLSTASGPRSAVRISGDVLASGRARFEFVDWGGSDHVGGGSHGSLHRQDSEGVLMLCGVDPPDRDEWSLTDVAPLVLDHFHLPFDT